MPAATLISAVSTAAVAAEERLAFWEQYNADALIGLTCSTYEDDGLLARQVNLDLDGLAIADISGNAHVIERAPALVRERPKQATFLSVLVEGEAFFYSAGGLLQLTAGDVLVYDTDRPYLFGFGTAMRQVLVDIPRPLVTELVGAALTGGPSKVSGQGAGAAAVCARTLRERLLDLVDGPGTNRPVARDELLELTRPVLTGAGSATGTAHLVAAKAFVTEHLSDPGLCADSVARAVGVTARHLNRVFAVEGTTLAQYIQGRRLDGARVELARSTPGDRIADVAARWGFASQAHFARLFRARYGRTPSEARSGVTGG